MDSVSNARADSKLAAYTVPMLAFVGFLGLVGLLKITGSNSAWLRAPEYWVYPLQTLVCGALLVWYRRRYELHRLAGIPFVILVAVGVFLLCIAPQSFLGFAPRQ